MPGSALAAPGVCLQRPSRITRVILSLGWSWSAEEVTWFYEATFMSLWGLFLLEMRYRRILGLKSAPPLQGLLLLWGACLVLLCKNPRHGAPLRTCIPLLEMRGVSASLIPQLLAKQLQNLICNEIVQTTEKHRDRCNIIPRCPALKPKKCWHFAACCVCFIS